MSGRLKPIPQTQLEVTEKALGSPYLNSQGNPIQQTMLNKANRGTDYSMKDDTVKDISIGLEDIDEAIMYYFKNIIKPTVVQNEQQIAVPVIYGSPERWKSVQADGFARDNSGRLLIPLIMFKRESFEKNRTLGNKLDGNIAHLYQVVGSKYNRRNAYDQFDLINNRIPSEQYYVTIPPDYIDLTYNCIVFTDFVEQNNKITEAIEYTSDSYWGNPARWKFRASIDSFTTTTLLNEGEDRAAKTSFNIKVQGYIIPNTVNKTLATTRGKFYTKSQVVFTLETVSTVKSLNPKASALAPQSSVIVQPDVESIQIENLAAPPTMMGASIGVDSYNVNLTSNVNVTVSGSVLAEFLNSNTQVIATTVTSNTATFPNGWLTPPYPLPALTPGDFSFFINGQFIEPTAISDFVDNLNNTSTLTVDNNQLGFLLNSTDEIVSIGKFA